MSATAATTERGVSVTRSDSTENLLMDLSPPEVPEVLVAEASTSTGLTLSPGTLTPGALSPGVLTPGVLTPGVLTPGTSPLAAARLHKQLRPMLTAPSFEQRPPELRDSPWSSTETSSQRSHSRKNSACLVGDIPGSNNNTLAIGMARSAPPSQSSVDSGAYRYSN